MRPISISVRELAVDLALMLLVSGCDSELKWRVIGPLDAQAPSVGPLQIEALPVDTAELDHDHPFRWRGSETAGFMLFDLRITNTGGEDLLCQVGHLDFPGLASPDPALAKFPETEAVDHEPEATPLVAASDLRLTAVTHELATILMADARRYQILGYTDFSARYSYLMLRDVGRAHVIGYLGYAPYTFGIPGMVSVAVRDKAQKHMPERLIKAQQMVMRPGIVPGGATVRGYLVFAWPEDPSPGTFTLRIPVQPAHAASVHFNLVQRD